MMIMIMVMMMMTMHLGGGSGLLHLCHRLHPLPYILNIAAGFTDHDDDNYHDDHYNDDNDHCIDDDDDNKYDDDNGNQKEEITLLENLKCPSAVPVKDRDWRDFT